MSRSSNEHARQNDLPAGHPDDCDWDAPGSDDADLVGLMAFRLELETYLDSLPSREEIEGGVQGRGPRVPVLSYRPSPGGRGPLMLDGPPTPDEESLMTMATDERERVQTDLKLDENLPDALRLLLQAGRRQLDHAAREAERAERDRLAALEAKRQARLAPLLEALAKVVPAELLAHCNPEDPAADHDGIRSDFWQVSVRCPGCRPVWVAFQCVPTGRIEPYTWVPTDPSAYYHAGTAYPTLSQALAVARKAWLSEGDTPF